MRCGYFEAGRCRSCTLLQTPYPGQLADKQRAVADGLGRGIAWLDPVPSAESGFRNKAKLVVAGTWRRPTLGILDPAGRGVDLRRCALYEQPIVDCQPVLADLITGLGLVPYDVPRRCGDLKYVLVTASPAGRLMLRFVLRTADRVGDLRAALPGLRAALPGVQVVSVNLHPEHKAVLEGAEEIVLTRARTLPVQVGRVRLHLGVQSFFQTNTQVAVGLYRQAADWVDGLGVRRVWDLYCGVGGFALHLAGPGRVVTGVEISAPAIGSARRSATELGLGQDRVRFVAADATTFPAHTGPDLVLVNPPRRGLGPQLTSWLEGSDVPHLLYSSCNIASLARDLDAMPSFAPVAGRLFDMFPHTTHHEVLLRLSRR